MTTPSRLPDRITALTGSIDVFGFTPFLSPLIFFVNENLWSTMTLMASLAAILLTIFVVIGWRGGRVQADGNVRVSLSTPGFTEFGWRPFAGNSRHLLSADRGRVHL